jgi:hypothetical protein
MEGSMMVDWRRIGRGRRKGWSESWSLHSYRGHEPEGKEIWKGLKQSLGCIAHSRTLPWLAYCFRVDQNGCWRSAFPHAEGVEKLMGALPRTTKMFMTRSRAKAKMEKIPSRNIPRGAAILEGKRNLTHDMIRRIQRPSSRKQEPPHLNREI